MLNVYIISSVLLQLLNQPHSSCQSDKPRHENTTRREVFHNIEIVKTCSRCSHKAEAGI